MRKKYLLFLCILPLLVILAACGDATMHLKNDGSGKMEIELPNNDYYSAEDVESELEAGMAHEDGFSKLSVKEKKDKIIASFQFDSLENVDTYAYLIPVADYVITENSRLQELAFVDDTKEFKENSKEIFVKLPPEMESFNSVKVILPGKVVAHSFNLDVVEKDTVEMSSYGDNYVVYSPSNISSFLIWGIVLFIVLIFFVLIAGVVVFLMMKKKKNQENSSSEDEEVNEENESGQDIISDMDGNESSNDESNEIDSSIEKNTEEVEEKKEEISENKENEPERKELDQEISEAKDEQKGEDETNA